MLTRSRKPLAFTTLCSALVASSIAYAGQLIPWGSAGGWDVLIDPSLGNGCLIQAEYSDGSLVRIGFDRNVGEGYVTAFNTAWGDIEEGERYGILFDLDGEEYDATAKGIYLRGIPGADIYFDNPDFLFDIAASDVMQIFNENGFVTAIELGGSDIGLEAIIECQEEVD